MSSEEKESLKEVFNGVCDMLGDALFEECEKEAVADCFTSMEAEQRSAFYNKLIEENIWEISEDASMTSGNTE